MLFPQASPQVANFWMKNTYIPLDMVFVGEDGRIAKIIANAHPFSLDVLSSDVPVIAVLEIRGGEAHDARPRRRRSGELEDSLITLPFAPDVARLQRTLPELLPDWATCPSLRPGFGPVPNCIGPPLSLFFCQKSISFL